MHQFTSFASPCDDVPGRRDPNRRAQASQAGGHYTRNTCNLSPTPLDPCMVSFIMSAFYMKSAPVCVDEVPLIGVCCDSDVLGFGFAALRR